VIGIKSLRSSFSIPEVQYFVFALSILFAKYDARLYQPSVLITYFFFSILFAKVSRQSVDASFQAMFVSRTRCYGYEKVAAILFCVKELRLSFKCVVS